MIKVVQLGLYLPLFGGDPAQDALDLARANREDLRRVIRSINFSESDLPFPALGVEVVQAFAAGIVFYGGVAVDRSVFRRLLPDARWLVYAAGGVSTSDANTATLGLYYQTDAGATIALGTITHTGGFTKKVMGPFDVFATGGVPAGETVPMIRLGVTKNVAGNVILDNWVVWLRLLAPKR